VVRGRGHDERMSGAVGQFVCFVCLCLVCSVCVLLLFFIAFLMFVSCTCVCFFLFDFCVCFFFLCVFGGGVFVFFVLGWFCDFLWWEGGAMMRG